MKINYLCLVSTSESLCYYQNKIDATHIRQYRHICFLNVSFKIFKKVAVNRLTGTTDKLIDPSQTTFTPGRNIMEGVVVLHETIHELHRKKMSGVILKLDFEKTYDKVN
jgi:hypothetical protein